jgi:hypothetical protein
MTNDIKLSQIYYPIINTLDDTTKYIVDAKIVYIIENEPENTTNIDFIKAVITDIDNDIAKIDLYLPNYTIKHLTIPVINISNISKPTDSESYLLVTKDLDIMTNLYYEIHPDCLFIMQKAPVISVGIREGAISMDTAYTEYKHTYTDTIYLEDGYNVNVSGTDNSIDISAGKGLGKGVFRKDPLNPDKPIAINAVARGLRSINGINNNVELHSSSNYITIDSRYMQSYECSSYSNDVFDVNLGIVIDITVTDNGEILV